MQRVPTDYLAEILLPALRRFAFCFVKTSYDADDLVQARVRKALSRLDQFDGREEGLRKWTFTILRNTYLNNYRRSRGANRLNLRWILRRKM